MERKSALLASSLLLGLILGSTILVALVATPQRGYPSQRLITASNVATNSTSLSVRLIFPNRTTLASGTMFAGTIPANISSSGDYLFSNLVPGIYPLNISDVQDIFLPSTSVRISHGANFLNLTIYQLKIIHLFVTSGITYNDTSPGPYIEIKNGTAVQFVIYNNTTLISNLAIVRQPFNTTSSNIVFDSLSNTLNAGGNTNDTFIASNPGFYFYESLIGSYAKDGQYGYFVVSGP